MEEIENLVTDAANPDGPLAEGLIDICVASETDPDLRSRLLGSVRRARREAFRLLERFEHVEVMLEKEGVRE